jgi:DNA-binding transcriptional LysR family regulator
MPILREPPDDDLNVEFLFDDPLVVVAGDRARWASRRKVDLAQLIDEPWILSPPNTWNYMGISEAFRSRGLVMPKIRVLSSSLHVNAHLLANGPFITALAKSLADQSSLKALPVELPARPWRVAIVTLKNRTLSPVVDRFVECAREVAKTIVGSARRDTGHRRKPDVS